MARHAGRHDAHAEVGVVALDRDLVEKLEISDLDPLDLPQAEVQENRLLHPFVHGPAVVAALGDPNVSRIEEGDGVLDWGGVELPGLPQLVDPCRQLHHAGSSPSGLVRKRRSTS